MILAYHLILTNYGFWLPNDPRGAGSSYVGMDDLYREFGPATEVQGERSVASRDHNSTARRLAKKLLPRPPVRFTGRQARSVAHGFRDYAARSGLPIYALAILPTHTHILVAYHKLRAESVLNQLKGAATRQLRADDFWRSPETPWARAGRHRFVDHPRYLTGAIRYISDNPVRDRLPRQAWSFTQLPKFGPSKIAE